MSKIATIGLDIAKHVFQVHGIDAAGALGSGDLMGWTASAPHDVPRCGRRQTPLEEAAHGEDYNDRSGHRLARFPGSRYRRIGERGDQAPVEAQ